MIYINNRGRPPGIFQIILGLFMLFAFLYVVLRLTKWILYGLGVIAPVLLVAAAVLNFATVKNFVRYLWKLIRRNPIMGIGLTLLAIIGFPITCALLFVRSLTRFQKRRRGKRSATADGSEYIDYEIVEEEPSDWLKIPRRNS